MKKRKLPYAFEGTREELLAHPAVQAWRRLGRGKVEPAHLDILKGRADWTKSQVYRLVGAGPDGSAVIAKRCRKGVATLEHRIYEEVLPRLPVPSLRFHGWVEGDEPQELWLFLEDAGGVKYSARSPEHRALAGRWLGLLHAAAVELPACAELPDAGPRRSLAHLRTARSNILRNLGNPALSKGDHLLLQSVLVRCDALEERWDGVLAWCEPMPRTLVHGDFVSKNLRVRGEGRGSSLLVFDWEYAGFGAPAADLAQTSLATNGFVAGPDLDTYASVARVRWPGLEREDVVRLALCGKVFRCLAGFHWASKSLEFAQVEGTVERMQVYEAELALAMEAGGWTSCRHPHCADRPVTPRSVTSFTSTPDRDSRP